MKTKALRGFDDLDDDKPKNLLEKISSKIDEFRWEDGWLNDKVDDLLTFLKDIFYYNPRGFIRNLKRSIDYVKLGWNNYDWDGGYLYEVIQFKLKRMLPELENGHAIPNQYNELKALKLAIKLGDKLLNSWDSYKQFSDLHNKKWGEVNISFEKVEGSKCSRILSNRPNANTEEEKEKENKELREAWKKDRNREDRDRKIYFGILEKYIDFMWD